MEPLVKIKHLAINVNALPSSAVNLVRHHTMIVLMIEVSAGTVSALI